MPSGLVAGRTVPGLAYELVAVLADIDVSTPGTVVLATQVHPETTLLLADGYVVGLGNRNIAGPVGGGQPVVGNQDAAIVGEADRAGCGVIIAANKWDLMKGQGVVSASEFDAEARRKAKFVDYAPLLHISAMTGERLPRLLEAIDRVAAARERRVPTGELNRFFETVTARHAPVSAGRRGVRVLYSAQTGVAPPTFVCFTNVATQFHFSYVRFLTNQLREAFGYEGSPIRLHVRRRRK